MFRRMKLLVVCALVVATGAVGSASAQQPFSADAGVGLTYARGGHFTDYTRGHTVWHASADIRVAAAHGLDWLVGAGFDGYAYGADYIDFCAFDSRGGCLPDFPTLRGPSLQLGARYSRSRQDVTMGLGGGWYAASAPHGSTRGGGSRGGFFELKATTGISEHTAFIVGAKALRLPDLGGASLWLTPVWIGLRVR